MKKLLTLIGAAALAICFLTAPSKAAGETADWQRLLQEGLRYVQSIFTQREPEEKTMNMNEILSSLESIGIHISPETQAKYDIWLMNMKRRGMGQEETVSSVVRELLAMEGIGDYDYNTGVWKPTSSEVYSFDAEVFDVPNMYRLFLQGVAAIVPGFDYTDAQESIQEREQPDMPPLDYEHRADIQAYLAEMLASGTLPDEGTTTVSFRLNGHEYKKELVFRGDWFNEEAIDWVNGVLAQEGFEGRLYPYFDGGQGVILIYGSEEKNAALQALMPDLWY